MRNRVFSRLSCVLPFLLCTVSVLWSFGGNNPHVLRTRILAEARTRVGSGYRYGGTGPEQFDCSGLVYSIYSGIAKVTLPRRAEDQWMSLAARTRGNPEPGDLVFFREDGRIFHVGISLGDKRFISALSEPPVRGVEISQLSQPYWRSRYAGYVKPVPSGKSLWLDYRAELGGIFSALSFGEGSGSDVFAARATGFRVLGGVELVWQRLALGVEGGIGFSPSNKGFVLPVAVTLGVDRRMRVSVGVKAALASLFDTGVAGQLAPGLGASLVVLEIPAGSLTLGLTAGVQASLWRTDYGTGTWTTGFLTESGSGEGRGLASVPETGSKAGTRLGVEFSLGLGIR